MTTKRSCSWSVEPLSDLSPYHQLLWDATTTTESDITRWVGQGIRVLRPEAPLPSNLLTELAEQYTSWGLSQEHGGPCGVLAAAQAEMLRLLLQGRSEHALAGSLAVLLTRAALTPSTQAGSAEEEPTRPVCVVLPTVDRPLTYEDFYGNPDIFRVHSILPTPTTTTAGLQEHIDHVAETLVQPFLVSHLPTLARAGGVLLLVLSVLHTRGRETVAREADLPTTLTAQFGHCSQELINLLLTGQAVSNVFDHTMTVDAMVCRGIAHRPMVGYLSQLEALRYCQVGDYYKHPQSPVWVVGSTSHFTVLFGETVEESSSDKLLEQCRRAFKRFDDGESGFVRTDKLGPILQELDVNLGGDAQVATLAAALEVSGAGIILWDDFWKASSRLLTGTVLERVLQGNEPAAPAAESDEEMARRLAREWGDEGSLSTLTQAAAMVESVPTKSDAMSDEEYARKLQAEWDAEDTGGTSSVAAVGEADVDDIPGMDIESEVDETESKPSATAPTDPQAMNFESFGDTFTLYHYNGLRGGILTPFRVTRLSAEEAVGASIALSRGGTSNHQSGSADLEDVVRTKWPSSMINWMGKAPPFID